MESSDQDYLTDYRLFFDKFYQSLDLDNPLPVHIGKYNIADFEIVGEIVCWCLEYLNNRNCPSSLIAPLVRTVINEMQDVVRREPESCGYRAKEDDYQTLRLMQATIRKLNEVCLKYRDNSEVSRLPPPPPVPPSVSAAAAKNGRRTMEDCHIIINDLHALFGIEGYGVASYYAVFDGHIGSDAALYSCSHLYQYLVESPYYPSNPEAAFKEAFIKTDERFIDKSNKENLKSGTTAVCILIRHDLGKLYVAWVGDSQAILVNGKEFIQLVNPHHPEQPKERERIEKQGGSVLFWGTWRVNGQLAVSRAIGDLDYKPYVSADADVNCYELSGDEDFLLLACDGLWDVLNEQETVEEVYKILEQNKGDRSCVAQCLVQSAKSLGSKDNISVVLAWLDMSAMENGHFPLGAEVLSSQTVSVVDSADDILPPVLKSIKPAVQPAAACRLDENAEQWLKTLPWSYADAVRKPVVRKEEPPSPPPAPAEQPAPRSPPPPAAETTTVPVSQPAPSQPEDKVSKGELLGDVGGEGDSEEDSDEEWNYVCGKNSRSNQHNKQELSEEDMESQLNPNAAEFIPVFSQHAEDLKGDSKFKNDVVISHSPNKKSELRALDGVTIPSSDEFLNEISKRPSEIDDLGENEQTLNGTDLTNVSTKAVFGDDSQCFNDSNLIQSEALKSTNPFASSEVPSFIQDHFSAPDFSFNQPNEVQEKDENKENVFEGHEDLAGLSFSNGLSAEQEEVNKQGSPLLRESPEPGLYNGRAGHEDSSPEVDTNGPTDSGLASDPLPPSDFVPDQTSDINNVSEFADQGPETCVDSESEDDILLSPSKKENNLKFEEDFTKKLVDDALNEDSSLKNQEMVNEEQVVELETENVYHKDEEDNEDLCCIKPSSETSLLDEVQSHLENLSLEPTETHKASDDLINISNEVRAEATDHDEENPAEEICTLEPKEECVCTMKETPLLENNICTAEPDSTSAIEPESLVESETKREEQLYNFDDEESALNVETQNAPVQEELLCTLHKEDEIHNHKEENNFSIERNHVDDLVEEKVETPDEVEACVLKKEEETFGEFDNLKKDLIDDKVNLVDEELLQATQEAQLSQQPNEELFTQETQLGQQQNEDLFTLEADEPSANEDEGNERPPSSPADFSKIADSLPPQRTDFFNLENVHEEQERIQHDHVEEAFEKEIPTTLKSSEVEEILKVEENEIVHDKASEQTEGIIDEMSSSMIDYGEDKALPEVHTNILNLGQDLQNENHDKNEADTESDSGFEIINASEASTIEMEMKIQSEKEAGAIDEKLLLDKNEAELKEEDEKAEVLEKESKIEEVLKPVENAVETVLATPATPPATPAQTEEESKDGLLAAVAVAAAGAAAVVTGGAVAAAVSDKKAAPPKKPEPVSKTSAKPLASKPAPSKAAPAKPLASKALPATKAAPKPSSPATKPTTTTRPGSATTKPATPTSRTAPSASAAKTSKPTTPTTAKPAATTTALKSKPTSTTSTKPAPAKPAATSAAKPLAAKPASSAAKKPSSPTSTTAKTTVGSKPAAATKPAAPAKPLAARPASSVSAKPAATAAAKPAATKPAVSKAPATSTAKAPAAPSSRPSSATTRTALSSKPTATSTTKVQPKPAATGAKPLAAKTTTSATKAPASKAAAPKAVPPKPSAGAPLNKKPAAPTAIKKPPTPADKNAKEANNKLASAKTAVKIIEDKKIISKKDDIIEDVEPCNQEPTVTTTTTNGHIELIENGITTPDIMTEVN